MNDRYSWQQLDQGDYVVIDHSKPGNFVCARSQSMAIIEGLCDMLNTGKKGNDQ